MGWSYNQTVWNDRASKVDFSGSQSSGALPITCQLGEVAKQHGISMNQHSWICNESIYCIAIDNLQFTNWPLHLFFYNPHSWIYTIMHQWSSKYLSLLASTWSYHIRSVLVKHEAKLESDQAKIRNLHTPSWEFKRTSLPISYRLTWYIH